MLTLRAGKALPFLPASSFFWSAPESADRKKDETFLPDYTERAEPNHDHRRRTQKNG